MNLFFQSYAMVFALAGWGAATLCAGDSQEFVRRKAPPKRATGVSFAEPDAPRVNTNTPTSTLPQPTLGTLDQSIRKPFEIFKSEDSFNGVLSAPIRRPPQPVVKNKRAEEMKERKKNWVFSTPEEMYGLQTPEEMLDVPEFGPDGEMKMHKTTFERYLDRLEKKRVANSTNQAGSDQLPSWMKPGEREDKHGRTTEEAKPAAESSSGNSLLSSLATETKHSAGFDSGSPLGGGAATTGERGDGLFNFSSSADKPLVKDTAREARMQEFKQMLDSRSVAGSTWGASPPAPLASPATVTPFVSGSYGVNSFDARPVSRPPSLPSMSPVATAPSYFAPSVNPYPTAPTTRTPVPSSSFELPKRKY